MVIMILNRHDEMKLLMFCVSNNYSIFRRICSVSISMFSLLLQVKVWLNFVYLSKKVTFASD